MKTPEKISSAGEPEPQNIEILTEADKRVLEIKNTGINLDYLDPTQNTFFCKASCMTTLDTQNKFTEGLYDCVSLIILATKNGEHVSLVSHFNPKTIEEENERLGKGDGRDYFEEWLRTYLSNISEGVDQGSVRSYTAGGKEEERFLEYGEDSPLAVLSGKDDYTYLKNLLTSVSYETLKTSPTVALPPAKIFTDSYETSDTRVYINTQEQKIYIVRSESVS